MTLFQHAASIPLIDALGGGDYARYAGGCVRNAVIGMPITDIDIATTHTPDAVMALCTKAGIKTVPTGLDHGTITAVLDGQGYEVTTLRRDVATDGRRATVAFTTDWAVDAQRRDFTMNTLLADTRGQIFDPLGTGFVDAKAGRVVFVGNPAERIAEDVLRILRFFRFRVYYGQGTPDKAALKACAGQAHKIMDLSRERITQEMLKIIAHERAADTLALMAEYNVLPDISSNAPALKALEGRALGIPARLVALNATDHPKLLLTKAQRKQIKAIKAVPALTDDIAIKKALYYHGRDAVTQAYLLRAPEPDKARLVLIQNWDIPAFPLTGEDLIKEGFSPGPSLGQELERRKTAWLDQQCGL